jgi:hypothetical protein
VPQALLEVSDSSCECQVPTFTCAEVHVLAPATSNSRTYIHRLPTLSNLSNSVTSLNSFGAASALKLRYLRRQARVVPTTSPIPCPLECTRGSCPLVVSLWWSLVVSGVFLGALFGVSFDCLGRHLVPGGAFLCLRLGVTCANLGTAPPLLHHEPLLLHYFHRRPNPPQPPKPTPT